jgi:L-ascorbate metabolism protein UlaG (beta-lactamase superfamily)
MNAKIQCIGQTTVCVELDKTRIYFDPHSISDRKLKKATHIFLSGIYFEKKDIDSIKGKKTVIYCPPSLAKELEDYSPVIISPKQKVDNIEVIPAYKADKIISFDRPLYNGYLISLEKESFYFAGPTDLVPEMNIINATVAFLPVDGNTMDIFEAVAATNVIHAETFVPIAYADSTEDGLRSCKRFTLKCVHPSELYRKGSDIVEVNNNI